MPELRMGTSPPYRERDTWTPPKAGCLLASSPQEKAQLFCYSTGLTIQGPYCRAVGDLLNHRHVFLFPILLKSSQGHQVGPGQQVPHAFAGHCPLCAQQSISWGLPSECVLPTGLCSSPSCPTIIPCRGKVEESPSATQGGGPGPPSVFVAVICLYNRAFIFHHIFFSKMRLETLSGFSSLFVTY